MADAPRATPSAEATGFRSRVPQVAGKDADRAGVFCSALHRGVSCSRRGSAAVARIALNALNSTSRLARGIPYPLTSDSVRCHA